MNAALTYAFTAVHQAELHAAAERSRRAPRKPRRERGLPLLPRALRRRRAYA
jgi:hypothetical protein